MSKVIVVGGAFRRKQAFEYKLRRVLCPVFFQAVFAVGRFSAA